MTQKQGREQLEKKIDKILNNHVDFAEWATDSTETTKELLSLFKSEMLKVIGEDTEMIGSYEYRKELRKKVKKI